MFSLFYLVHDFDPNITFTYSDGVPRRRRAVRVWKFWKMPSQKQQQIPIRVKALQSISILPSRKYAIKTHSLLDNAPNYLTQGGKGNSEGKKVQQSLTSKLSIGMFMWFKIVKIKRIHEAILEGWSTNFGQNGLCMLTAISKMASWFFLVFAILNQFNIPITYFEVRICWTFFPLSYPCQLGWSI